jgi:hypothetical protein
MKTPASLWSLAAFSLFMNATETYPVDSLTPPETCITLNGTSASLEDILSSSDLSFPAPLRHAHETPEENNFLDNIKMTFARFYGQCLYFYYHLQQWGSAYKKQQGK